MRALWILEEMGLPFELHELDFSMASLRDPTFLAVSPWAGALPRRRGAPGSSNPAPSFNTWANTTTAKPIPADLHRASGTPERTDWLIWLHYAETMAVHGASYSKGFSSGRKPLSRGKAGKQATDEIPRGGGCRCSAARLSAALRL